ncbi:hypothetical protein GMD78_15110 [Ornithinibacillus sp. L9]|uniref:Uncharacterized protein n=1 Tax=Ornithinibacillus caprae TaxID=2678566 RepID=A0A6N8FNP0_9BACI|nr:hypothetical protein [Ornithinibacillus caprae]MUK89697.1 hypothetical protein [Ornithinibacillus caprae]
MSPYVFSLAAVLAVVPMLIVFKINIEKLKENPENIGKLQTNFFIGAAISEAIPLILIVFGIANMETVAATDELLIPGIIVILTMVIGSFFVFLQRSVGVPEELKEQVTTFAMVGVALINAIPIISIVSLMMMAP